MLLENMFQIDHVPLPAVPMCVNADYKRFGTRNLKHVIFPKSFSTWVFNKYREKFGLQNAVPRA